MATAHVFRKDLMKSKVSLFAVLRGTVNVPSTSNMAIVFGFNGCAIVAPPSVIRLLFFLFDSYSCLSSPVFFDDVLVNAL